MAIFGIEDTTFWILSAIGLYWIYCIFWGVKGYLQAKSAAGYYIAGRSLPIWLFVLAATATSFSGWTYVGHPGTIFNSGIAYAYAGLYAITIPFTGVTFLKRQWILGKRYGFITPPEMYRRVFDSKWLGYSVVLVATLYSIFYLAVQLMASGLLFSVLTNGFIPFFVGAVALSMVLVFYVSMGGLRSVAYVDAVQFFLLAAGIIIIGYGAINAFGGIDGFLDGLTKIDPFYTDSHGAILLEQNWKKFIPTLGDEGKTMGMWTGVMMFSYMLALAGIQCSPAFTMWGFSNKDPSGMAWQQVVGSTLIIGAILVIFSTIQGLSGVMLRDVVKQDLNGDGILDYSAEGLNNLIVGSGGSGGTSDALVPKLMLDFLPLPLLVLVSVGGLAAMQSTGAPYISSFAAIFSREIISPYLRRGGKTIADSTEIWIARGLSVVVVALAFSVAFFRPDLMVMLGGLAVSFAFQLFIALFAMSYLRNTFTGKGITAGVFAGLLAVILTYGSFPVVGDIFPAVNDFLGQYQYPLSIHCCGWGILANLVVTVLVSAMTQQTKEEKRMRNEIHDYFAEVDQPTPSAQKWRNFVKLYAPFWWIMAFIGAPMFANGFWFGVPAQWVWLAVWWALGLFMMWAMAWGAQMSTMPKKEVVPIDAEAAKTTET